MSWTQHFLECGMSSFIPFDNHNKALCASFICDHVNNITQLLDFRFQSYFFPPSLVSTSCHSPSLCLSAWFAPIHNPICRWTIVICLNITSPASPALHGPRSSHPSGGRNGSPMQKASVCGWNIDHSGSRKSCHPKPVTALGSRWQRQRWVIFCD